MTEGLGFLGRHLRVALTFGAFVAVAALCGCSGSDDSPTGTAAGESRTTEATTGPAAERPAERSGTSRSDSAPAVPPGPPPKRVPTPVPKTGDRSIQTFGKAASSAEFVEVANAVRGYHLALASGDGRDACALLSSTVQDQMVRAYGAAQARDSSAPGERPSCATALEAVFKSQTPEFERQLAKVRVTDARLKAARASRSSGCRASR